jgi:agmatine deiminase
MTRRRFLAVAASGAAAMMFVRPGSAFAVARRFRVPIDSWPHERTWMAWPDSRSIWGRQLDGAQANIALIARTIARYERVTMCANPGSADHAKAACRAGVEVITTIPVDDCWMRDSGPIFRVDGVGRVDAIGLNFNGWGNKQTHRHDARVARRVAAHAGVSFTAARFVSEGGAIETDGHGTLMATRSSILNPNRNPGVTLRELEAAMTAAYGASKVIWFHGIRGRDITDDHVDGTSRFLAHARALVQYPAQATDHDIWSNDERQQYHLLSYATSAHNTRIETSKLIGPIWSRIRRHKDPNFVDSYVNYYVCNGAVICPQFGDKDADEAVATKLGQLFPGRDVVALNIDNLGAGGGGIHCVTQQQPLPTPHPTHPANRRK